MKMQDVTIGIDIGGTNTVIGFIDTKGKYLVEDSISTLPDEEAEKFISRLSERIKLLYGPLQNQYNIIGIGVAAPNANYYSGIIETPSNLKWRNVNFVKIMESYFNHPVSIINDANAAALGEQIFGQAKGMKNFIEITLGTGLGSGIVIDGNILLGENGFAGEIGHTIVEPNGRLCNCGRKGCLETYASASGISRTVFFLLSHYNVYSKLRDIPFNQLNGEMISELALKGDPIALQAFEFTGEVLGKALANVSLYYSPEAIILFGGLANAGELLLKPTRHYFEKNLLNVFDGRIKILQSKLQDGNAAVLGASSLILKEINRKKNLNYVQEL